MLPILSGCPDRFLTVPVRLGCSQQVLPPGLISSRDKPVGDPHTATPYVPYPRSVATDVLRRHKPVGDPRTATPYVSYPRNVAANNALSRDKPSCLSRMVCRQSAGRPYTSTIGNRP
uniref:Uncharacterized protein n=1 Tax=Oryza nivara TaxID=4536 RepID=A0A0E0HSW8_ORYNI